VREQLLRIFNPDRLGLVILFVCEYCILALLLGLALAAHACRQPDRPGLTLCEFVTRVFGQFLFGEPHGFLLIHAVACHFVAAQVGDWNHLFGAAVVLTFLAFHDFQHSLGYFIAPGVNSYVFDACSYCFLGCEQ